MNNSNSEAVLQHLVKETLIPVTHSTIKEELEKQSDPFSLAALSDILDHWVVPNAAYKVSVEELLETEIPLPFICCFSKGEFALISQIDRKNVTVSNDRWNNHQLNLDEFKNYYKGTILAFEKNSSSGEMDFTYKRRIEIINNFRIPFVFLGLLFFFSFLLLQNPGYITGLTLSVTSLILLKSVGFIISILLIIQSLDANNPLIARVCGNNKNRNCNAILGSKAAKIFSVLSWSEVGFFYFSGTWLVVLLYWHDFNILRSLAVLNLLCLPYTFYSFYYQWRIAKQWCVFCCTILALLWLELFAFMPFLADGIRIPDWLELSKLTISMLVPILLWVFLKTYFVSFKELKLIKPELYKFKYNKELFRNILEKENKYALPTEEDTIVLGKRNSNTVVTFVSNPYCKHCVETHKILDNLLKSKEDIKLQLVFINRIRSKKRDLKVMRHFMALKSIKCEDCVKDAINDWYKQDKLNYELWKNQFPIIETEVEDNALFKQKAWCNLVHITSTPTLFINGRRLPEVYKVDDLQFVL